MSKAPTIYFAGKIDCDDWRETVVGKSLSVSEHNAFNPRYTKAIGNADLDDRPYIYGGPFFIHCNHGWAFGAELHGMASVEDALITASKEREVRQERIWQVNSERIKRADAVFAYITSPDCFGTVVEIGQAQALGKPFAIGFASKLLDVKAYADMWTLRQQALGVYLGPPQKCFNSFWNDHIYDLPGMSDIDPEWLDDDKESE